MISFHEARSKMLEGINSLPSEKCRLENLLGRILAQDITASFDIPPKDNSAMDGLSVIASDIAGASEVNPMTLQVIEDVPAGKVAVESIKTRAGDSHNDRGADTGGSGCSGASRIDQQGNTEY